MQFLYKRPGTPYWWARYKKPDGELVQRSTRCKDKGAALRFLREWLRGEEHEAADRAAGIERPSEVTFGELAIGYIAEVERTRRPRYVRALETHLKIRILPYFGKDQPAAAITRQAIEGFRRALLSGTAPANAKRKDFDPTVPMTAVTVNRHMVTVRRVLEFGLRTGHLKDNPAAKLAPLKVDQVERHRALAEGELVAFLKHLRPDDALWVRFLVETGLRDDEAAQLTYADIDQTRAVLTVRGTHAKSRRTRRVPLTREAVAVLDELGGDGVGLVFGKLVRRKRLAAAWKAAQFRGRFPTAHDFRHTFASRAIARGLDLEELREVMGHRSVITTQRYLHAYGDRWERMAKKLDAGRE